MAEPLRGGVAQFAREEVLSECRRRLTDGGQLIDFMGIQRLLQMRSGATWQVVASLIESGELEVDGVYLRLPVVKSERAAGQPPGWPGSTAR